ncbi:MAG: DnaJ domain-containing protein [Desulfobacterales bacterium]|nr:DnaJ domain-containing protein [Desulfobacterales bacterium]
MNIFTKIILILFGIAYFLSPIDIIPDFLIPFLGWLDDTFIIGIIIYLIRYGKLPYFKNFSRIFYSFKKTSENFTRNNQESPNINKSPYEILGIKGNASKKEIQKAYKEKVKQYHPDKVAHLGKELQKIANEKFIEINNAYEFLIQKP